MALRDEIREQPVVLRRILDDAAGPAGRARALLEDSRHALIAARGTSDNAARYAKYVWGAHLGVPVTLAAPSLYTRYGTPPDLGGATVVGISQSGQSPDLLAVLEEARRQRRPTIAIVNEDRSPLAELADVVVPLGAGPEHSVAATKTYTASLMAVALISADVEAVAGVPDAVAAVIDREREIGAVAAEMAPLSRAVVLGRGFNHATAFEWALKLQEMAYVFAHAFSTADFAHGPFAVLEDGFPVLALLPDGATTTDSLGVLRRAADEARADVTVITNTDVGGFRSIQTPPIAEWVTPMTFAAATQLFTLHLAEASGIDPESPRGLRKVTRTT